MAARRRADFWLRCKPRATRPPGGGAYYDTAFVVGPTGEIVFKQGKRMPIQFFNDGLPAPSQQVWDSPWGKLGFCICYDLSYRSVTDRLIHEGAQALIVPTMDVETWGRHEHELHARIARVRAVARVHSGTGPSGIAAVDDGARLINETRADFCDRTSCIPMNVRCLRLAQSAIHLPARVVTAAELDARLGLPAGWTEEKTGVLLRYYIEPGRDTNATMGAAAARAALDAAGLAFADVDLLLNASASIQQPIPCTAAFIQRELGEAAAASGVPCMDLNATCLSFLVGLELAGAWLHARRGGRVLLVSSEIASQGVDWEEPGAACLFGDGAAAFILEYAPGAETGVLASRFETYSEGANYCEVRGGAQARPPWTCTPENRKDFLFHMDGPAVHRLAMKRLPGLVEHCLAEAGVPLGEIAAVVPHQAGIVPIRLVERRLGLAPGRMVITVGEHGNLIAASIPVALHLARKRGLARPGDKVLLLGTAAGYSQGAMVWQL